MSISVDNDRLFVPDYENHYSELLAKLKEQEANQPADPWSVICGLSAAENQLSVDKRCELIADISVLWVLLIYIDLDALGIAPDLARLILLARLISDDAPASAIKHDLIEAVITVVDAAHAATKAE